MGYTTEFYGALTITPSLNSAERDYLTRFARTRRMDRTRGPYFVEGSGFMGQGADRDIRCFNQPPPGQPGLWCQWVPSEDGSRLECDGNEKFYAAERWMTYLIDHFLSPSAHAAGHGDRQFDDFTFDHTLDGEIEAQGEDPDNRWLLRVERNRVSVLEARVTYGEPQPVLLGPPAAG